MDLISALALGSLKALLLLVVAGGISLALKGRPARLRAVVWATALLGSLLIPLLTMVVPALPVELPVELGRHRPADRPTPVLPTLESAESGVSSLDRVSVGERHGAPGATESWATPGLDVVLPAIWVGAALLLLAHHGAGLWRMSRIVRRAQPIDDDGWLDLLEDVRRQIGCRQRVGLVRSSEIDIPSVFGLLRPVVVVPAHADTWLEERRTAVLQHELIHVARYDWPTRVAARLARAIYWFNPLAWWATRRLDLEQEMACDEEVLSLGSRASSYACHLLGIARTAVHRPALAVAGIEMARRSHLEERIMSILKRPEHRRVGLAVILPAAILTAALVPAIAAINPTEASHRSEERNETTSQKTGRREPRPASPELKAAMDDMRLAEERIEPTIEKITRREIELRPHLEELEAIEVEIDHEALAKIELEMQPIIEQIKAIEVDMAPVHAQIEAMTEALKTMEFHIEDGTFEEIQRQIHEQMEAHQAGFESIHVDMEPYHDQLEALHAQLEPLRERIEALHLEAVPSHREMERIHAEMEPFQEEMERLHKEMEPFHDEMERMGELLETALHNDVAAVLRSHLGPVTSPTAPFTEAAARIVEGGNIHIHNDVLELDVSRREVREILSDLFTPSRVGTQDAFGEALEEAVDEVSELEIETD